MTFCLLMFTRFEQQTPLVANSNGGLSGDRLFSYAQAFQSNLSRPDKSLSKHLWNIIANIPFMSEAQINIRNSSGKCFYFSVFVDCRCCLASASKQYGCLTTSPARHRA